MVQWTYIQPYSQKRARKEFLRSKVVPGATRSLTTHLAKRLVPSTALTEILKLRFRAASYTEPRGNLNGNVFAKQGFF